MAILLANLPGFALPDAAYANPIAWGGGRMIDIIVWFVTEALVDGRMRGLFSLLFGASLLLILQRADAAGANGAALHLRRMGVLFVIGLIHRTMIWSGDILAHYALVGVIALGFVGLSIRSLLIAVGILVGLQMTNGWLACLGLLTAAARDTPQSLALWNAYQLAFGTPGPVDLAREIAAMRGPWSSAVAFRLAHNSNPLFDLIEIGPETLSAMLLGMALFKSGFLTAQWERARYRRYARWGLGISVAAYAIIACGVMASGFDVRAVALAELFLTAPFRLVGTIGYAALILLALRPGGWWTTHLAAAGRMALSNYLGTSVLMTLLFHGHGLGQFARWDRAACYLAVPVVWAIMLLWSKPWLDRFGQGPIERLWRAAANGYRPNMRE
jgi:uncharacterized protein